MTAFGRTMIEKSREIVEEQYSIQSGHQCDAKVCNVPAYPKLYIRMYVLCNVTCTLYGLYVEGHLWRYRFCDGEIWSENS